MIDIKSLAAEKSDDAIGTVVVIKDRSGEPYLGADGKAATMTVLGEFSEPVQRARNANKRKLFKRLRTNPSEIDTSDETDISEALAAVTDWSGWELDGKPAPFTPENLRAVLTVAPWILRQVAVVVANPRLFSKSSSGS